MNKTENRITFKFKTGYYLQLLTPKAMKLLGSTENKISNHLANGDEFEECPTSWNYRSNVIHCNVFNNDYQQDSIVLYTFVPNKPFGELLEISTTNFTFLKTFSSEFHTIEVCFTD